MKSHIIFVFLILSILYTQTNTQTCEALILADGSDYGAYQAGVIQTLLEQGNVSWDVYSGVGTSALSAAVLNGFTNQQSSEMSQAIEAFWRGLRNDHVSKTYEGGMIYGQVYEKGFMEYQPLRKYLEENLQTQLGPLSFGSTDIDTGDYIRYNEKLQENETDFINAMMSAMSIPAYFPWRNFQEKNVFSGGVAQPADFVGALDRCLEITSDESNITFDVVSITSQAVLKEWGASQKNKPFQAFRRSTIIRSFRALYQQFSEFFESHPKITCRYYVEPTTQLYDAKWPFYFTEDGINQQIQAGQNDAQSSVQNGAGANCAQVQKKALIQSLKNIDPSFEDLSDQELEMLIQYN